MACAQFGKRGLRFYVTVVCSFCLCLGALVSVYWAHRLFEERRSAVLRKRKVALSIWTIAAMSVGQLLAALAIAGLGFQWKGLYYACSSLSQLQNLLCVYLVLWRSALISKEMGWTLRVVQSQWRSLLEGTGDSLLRDRPNARTAQRLGVASVSLALISWLILAMVANTRHTAHVFEVLCTLLVFSLPFALLLIVAKRIPANFQDAFLIKEEIQRLIVVFLGAMAVFVSLKATALKAKRRELALEMAQLMTVGTADFCASALCSYWVLHRGASLLRVEHLAALSTANAKQPKLELTHRTEWNDLDFNAAISGTPPSGWRPLATGSLQFPSATRFPLCVSRSSGFGQPLLCDATVESTTVAVPRSYSKNQVTLRHLFANMRAMEVFMDYLSKEFSVECMLSLVEFVQFQDYAVQRLRQLILDTGEGDANDAHAMCKLYRGVRMAREMPVSAIVHKSHSRKSWVSEAMQGIGDSQWDLNHELRLKSRMLYDKYIATESPLSIDIGFQTRRHLRGIIAECSLSHWLADGLAIADLVKLFDAVGFQMWHRLEASFARFKRTAAFHWIYDNVTLTELY